MTSTTRNPGSPAWSPTIPVQVRAPEQDTGPNVFYLGADRAVLDPVSAPVQGGYIYSTPDPHRAQVAADMGIDPITQARTTLDTAHPRPWGWRVTTYLWTKAVGAGAMMLATLAQLFGISLGGLGTIVAPALGVAGVASHRWSAGLGSQAPGALLLHPHQAQPTVLAVSGARSRSASAQRSSGSGC